MGKMPTAEQPKEGRALFSQSSSHSAYPVFYLSFEMDLIRMGSPLPK
jgi:hypothetical protein